MCKKSISNWYRDLSFGTRLKRFARCKRRCRMEKVYPSKSRRLKATDRGTGALHLLKFSMVLNSQDNFVNVAETEASTVHVS